MSILTLHIDIDCEVYIDTEYHGIAKNNTDYIVELNKGVYWLECVSVEDASITYNFDFLVDYTTGNMRKDISLLCILRKKQLQEHYDYIGEFIEGFAKVCNKSELVGYIDQSYRLCFDDVKVLGDGIIRVKRGCHYGILNGEHQEIIPIKYEEIELLGGNMFRLGLNRRYCLANIDGVKLTPHKYTCIADAQNSIYAMYFDKWYFVDSTYNKVDMPNNVVMYSTNDGRSLARERSDGDQLFDMTFGQYPILTENINGDNIIIFAKDVRYIGGEMFYNSSKLTNISIPNSVEWIKENAFYQCVNLQQITISNNILHINRGAFQGCCSLNNVTIPNSVTSLADNIFGGCINLKTFKGKYASDDGLCIVYKNKFLSFANGCNVSTYTVPNNVTIIGEYAFSGCDNIEHIILPDSIDTICRGAFSGCTNLKDINIPFGVKTIEEEAFQGCCSLKSIILPNGITTIASSVFSGCSSLVQITIPDNTISIGHFAFANCSGLRELHIPQRVTNLGDGVFNCCSSLERFVVPNNVTKIPNFTFAGCYNLKNVYLHNNIIEIGTSAFAHCTSLVNIKMPESVTIIGNSAFNGCASILEINIPFSVTSIGFGVFEDCVNIKKFNGKFSSEDGLCLIDEGKLLTFAVGSEMSEYIVPHSVVKIDRKAFSGCDTLTQITLSEDVIEIGEYAFLKCINLSRIKILGDIKTIKPNAFWDCDKITAFSGEIASSDGLCLIVNNELVAFARGCNMAHYTIPNEVIKIAPLVFRNCKYLQTIDIPDGVMTIEYCNFIQCPRLEKFYGKFASDDGLCVICGNKLIAYASNCGHKKYIIPNNVTEICDGAFYNCHNLIEIHIPNTVTKIGSQVWGNCTSLQSITFPENVYLIKNKCFIGCEDLTSIYFKPVVPPTDDLRCIGQPNFFNKETCDVTFYVLQDSISKYKHSWPQYADNIVGYSYED